MNLNGKIALLTGASKGLGRALAIELDRRGCRLILSARDACRLDSLLDVMQTPGSYAYPCDLGDDRSRSRLIAAIKDSEPRLDLIILNAGIGSHSQINQLSADEVRQVLQLNTIAPMELTASLLHLLPRHEPAGIVSIGSLAGELTVPGMSIYSASKAALHAFARAAEVELASQDQFSLLVILGALRGTRFAENIRNPSAGQPNWYRKLDVDAGRAAVQIVQAIQQQRSQLVIPAWYHSMLRLSALVAPLTRSITRVSYGRFVSKKPGF